MLLSNLTYFSCTEGDFDSGIWVNDLLEWKSALFSSDDSYRIFDILLVFFQKLNSIKFNITNVYNIS